jgi:hypothetical protein
MEEQTRQADPNSPHYHLPPDYCRTIAHDIHHLYKIPIEHEHKTPTITLQHHPLTVKTQLQLQYFKEWQARNARLPLAQYKLKPGVCYYMSNEEGHITKLRARLRLNCANINYVKFRRKLVDSPHCPHCPNQDETLEHLLLECPAYMLQRQELEFALEEQDLPLTIPIILDAKWIDTPEQREERDRKKKYPKRGKVLRATAEFIRQLHSKRGLWTNYKDPSK